jgi:hypothetical protein
MLKKLQFDILLQAFPGLERDYIAAEFQNTNYDFGLTKAIISASTQDLQPELNLVNKNVATAGQQEENSDDEEHHAPQFLFGHNDLANDSGEDVQDAVSGHPCVCVKISI